MNMPAQSPLRAGPDVGSAKGHCVHPTSIRFALIAAVWFLVAMVLSFGHGIQSDYLMAVVVGFSMIFFALTVGLATRAAGDRRWGAPGETFDQFMLKEIDTATRPTEGREALVEIAFLPFALAFGATVIGAVFLLSGG